MSAPAASAMRSVLLQLEWVNEAERYASNHVETLTAILGAAALEAHPAWARQEAGSNLANNRVRMLKDLCIRSPDQNADSELLAQLDKTFQLTRYHERMVRLTALEPPMTMEPQHGALTWSPPLTPMAMDPPP